MGIMWGYGLGNESVLQSLLSKNWRKVAASPTLFKSGYGRVIGITHPWRILADLPEDLGFVPSTHPHGGSNHNSSPRAPTSSYRHTWRQNTHRY